MNPERWTAENPGRLDREVAGRLGWSRAFVRLAVDAGRVRVGGVAATKPGASLRAGEELVVEIADWLQPEPDAPLATLAEGGGWAVFDKPAGQSVHPLRPDERGTLLQAAAARHGELLAPEGIGREGPLKSGVVHRIDAATSGCVVLARTGNAWDALRAAFAGHRAQKTYLARVAGRPEAGRLDAPMAVVKHRPARSGVVAEGGHATAMSWAPLSTDPAGRTTLVRVELETGFFHQIRAGLAHVGFPLVGDPLYRGPDHPRLMLHAWRLRIAEAGIDAEAPPPPGLRL